MGSSKKLTKKMLAPLMRGEMRKIAIVGLHLEPAEAYTMKENEITSWVYERAEKLAEVDLESIGTKTFRDGVPSYLEQLQSFIRGESPAPSWPPTEGATVTEIADKKAEEAKPKKAAAKKPRTTAKKAATPKAKPAAKAKKASARKASASPEAVVADAVVETVEAKVVDTATPETKLKFRKATLGTTKSAPVSEEAITKLQKALKDTAESATPGFVDLFEERLTIIEQTIQGLASVVEATRQEQTDHSNLLANALLYVINSALLDEGEEIADLSKIPSPENYKEE
jgi:hypothetical protein